MEAKSIKINRQSVFVDHLIQSTINSVSSATQDKSVSLDFVIQEGIPMAIEADPIRLKQILLNLVANAMKFTKRGSVVIKLNAVKIDDKRYEYHFQIQDTGIGISENQQQYLFERFVQVESSLSRTYGGAGLGLSISKQLCDLMGGGFGLRVPLEPVPIFSLRYRLKFPQVKRSPNLQSRIPELNRHLKTKIGKF